MLKLLCRHNIYDKVLWILFNAKCKNNNKMNKDFVMQARKKNSCKILCRHKIGKEVS